ncbi:MAG TPA: AAA family ATPase, partial [Candidatus Bipolaricaulis anaerobius]|nr:AAA family ATPase [Candidatus Bipolaricaulis anaerobius]
MPSPTTPKEDTLTVREVAERGDAVLSRIEEVIVGKREPLTLILGAILAGGHVLLEDYPGLAKTLAARCFSWTLGLSFRRIQFTPDLLPSDLLGAEIYRHDGQGQGHFVFQPGPLFAPLVLADEINRAPAKVQSAL